MICLRWSRRGTHRRQIDLRNDREASYLCLFFLL